MSEQAAGVTYEQIRALFDKISTQEREPHRCMVHPRGGPCIECGQPWRLVDGVMERVTFDG